MRGGKRRKIGKCAKGRTALRKRVEKTRRNYKEHESPKCQVTAGDNVGNRGGRRVVGEGGRD